MSLEDKAQEHEAAEWLARNTRRPEKPTYQPGEAGYGPEECEECLSVMPPLRRANGWVLCVGCQSAVERGRIRR